MRLIGALSPRPAGAGPAWEAAASTGGPGCVLAPLALEAGVRERLAHGNARDFLALG